MANPYHDENGRFSSANGMKDAVHRVAQGGNVGEYLTLREQYETAKENSNNSTPERSPWAAPTVDSTPLTGARHTLHKLLTDYGVNSSVADSRVRDGSAVSRLAECKTIDEASRVLSSLGVDEYEAERASYDLMERE